MSRFEERSPTQHGPSAGLLRTGDLSRPGADREPLVAPRALVLKGAGDDHVEPDRLASRTGELGSRLRGGVLRDRRDRSILRRREPARPAVDLARRDDQDRASGACGAPPPGHSRRRRRSRARLPPGPRSKRPRRRSRPGARSRRAQPACTASARLATSVTSTSVGSARSPSWSTRTEPAKPCGPVTSIGLRRAELPACSLRGAARASPRVE